MIRGRIWTALVVLVLTLGVVHPARTDAAPPPPPPHGLNIFPSQATHVRMVAEQVVIELVENQMDVPPRINVTASFLMHNNGLQPEAMEIRYPLSMVTYDQDHLACELSPFAPLSNFQTWIDGMLVVAPTLRERLPNTLATSSTDPAEVDRECWAVLPVIYPAGKDVSIQVSYTQDVSIADEKGFTKSLFVLESGASWEGTIGSAEVIFRAPWTLINNETLFNYSPERASIGEKEIRWQMTDFEPGEEDTISVETINPGVYYEINQEREQPIDSNDGEEWGLYAQAAKLAIMTRDGFRTGATAQRLYVESYNAYLQALTVLPGDAGKHAGFAELLCHNAVWPTFSLDWSSEERWLACATQLRQALDLDPQQKLAWQLLDKYSVDDNYFFIISKTPFFPILSKTPPPRNTLTPIPTLTLTPTPTAPPTSVPVLTNTPQPFVPVPATVVPGTPGTPVIPQTSAQGELTIVAASTATQESPQSLPPGGLCGAGLLPAAAAVLLIGKTRR